MARTRSPPDHEPTALHDPKPKPKPTASHLPTPDSPRHAPGSSAAHPNGPLVGQNRTLEVIEREAQAFLLDLHQAGFFPGSDDAFQERLQSVLLEIWGTSVPSVTEGMGMGVVGGTWVQTREELEVGVRRAWGDAGGCVMRSLCDELRLCDLRSVTRSTEMATELIKGLAEAYNGGDIIPTVFVFPPRAPNTTGPMIWNDRLLSFAGYELPDGTILGDPANTHLTTAILALGWVPPEPKTRWDVLPLVVSSSSPSSSSPSDDKPALIELPAPLRTPIQIHHPNPKHAAAFAALDLRWTAFRAPGRLGVEVGGVEYTAAPFVGWFMDSEIEAALADPGRYDVLPGVIKALDLDTESMRFEDLPKYEQLAIMSRAQVELTYAIHHSFLRAGVTIADPLSASKRWAQYVEKEGFVEEFECPVSSGSGSGSGIAEWGAPGEAKGPRIAPCAVDPVEVWRSRAEGLGCPPGPTESLELEPERETQGMNQEDPGGVEAYPSHDGQNPEAAPPESTPTPTPDTPLPNDAGPDSSASSWDAPDPPNPPRTPPPASPPLRDAPPSNSRQTPQDQTTHPTPELWPLPLIRLDTSPTGLPFSWDPDPDPFRRRDAPMTRGVLSVRLGEGEPDLDLDLELDLELSPLMAAENPLFGLLGGPGLGWEGGDGWSSPDLDLDWDWDEDGHTPGHPRSRFLSTIEEEGEGEGEMVGDGEVRVGELDGVLEEAQETGMEAEVRGRHDSGTEVEGEETCHAEIPESHPVIVPTDEPEPDPPKSPPRIPRIIITRDDGVGGDAFVDEKVERENNLPGVLVAGKAVPAEDPVPTPQSPPAPEPTTPGKTLLTSEAPTEQHPRLPMNLTCPTPSTPAYTGTLESPIRVLSGIFERMYAGLRRPRPYGVGILGVATCRSTLERPPTSEDSPNPHQPGFGCSTSRDGRLPPVSVGPGLAWGNRDAWDLATDLYLRAKMLAGALHDMVLTARPLNNLKVHLTRQSFRWPTTQTVWEAFEFVVGAVHGWVGEFGGSGRWRGTMLVARVRSGSVVVVDLLLVYLTRLRARWGGL